MESFIRWSRESRVVVAVLARSLVVSGLLTLSLRVIIGVSAFRIGVILPFNDSYLWSVPKTRPAIEYAVETVNAWPFLVDEQLEVLFADSQCSDTYAPLEAMQMHLNRRVDVFIGPVCDYAVAPIARFSPIWNIPVITGGALVRAFVDKRQYSLLTRIAGSYEKLGEFFVRVYEKFAWNVTSLIYSANLGVRQPLGRSTNYFIMESVYGALTQYLRQADKKSTIHHFSFDENAPTNDPVYKSATSLLEEIRKVSRSKQCPSFIPISLNVT